MAFRTIKRCKDKRTNRHNAEEPFWFMLNDNVCFECVHKSNKSIKEIQGGGEKCGVCGKTVYQAERQEAGKIIYHKLCFKCSQCKMSLNLNNYAQADKILFCKKHYQENVVAKNAQSTNVY